VHVVEFSPSGKEGKSIKCREKGQKKKKGSHTKKKGDLQGKKEAL